MVKGGFLFFRTYCRSFLLGPRGQRWFWISLTTLLNVMNEAVYLAHPLRQGTMRVCFPVIWFLSWSSHNYPVKSLIMFPIKQKKKKKKRYWSPGHCNNLPEITQRVCQGARPEHLPHTRPWQYFKINLQLTTQLCYTFICSVLRVCFKKRIHHHLSYLFELCLHPSSLSSPSPFGIPPTPRPSPLENIKQK